MNSRASRLRQPRIFEARRGYGSLSAFDSELERCSSPSIPLPRLRSFAWRNSEDNAVPLEEHGSPTLCFSSRVHDDNESFCCDAVADGVLMEMPFRTIFRQRAISPIFSLLTLGHSLGAYPAPCGTSMFCFTLRVPGGSGFPNKKSPCGYGPKNGRDFFFGASTESTSRPWERGTLASLRAGVSREQSGQIQTGETQWHSTKIT